MKTVEILSLFLLLSACVDLDDNVAHFVLESVKPSSEFTSDHFLFGSHSSENLVRLARLASTSPVRFSHQISRCDDLPSSLHLAVEAENRTSSFTLVKNDVFPLTVSESGRLSACSFIGEAQDHVDRVALTFMENGYEAVIFREGLISEIRSSSTISSTCANQQTPCAPSYSHVNRPFLLAPRNLTPCSGDVPGARCTLSISVTAQVRGDRDNENICANPSELASTVSVVYNKAQVLLDFLVGGRGPKILLRDAACRRPNETVTSGLRDVVQHVLIVDRTAGHSIVKRSDNFAQSGFVFDKKRRLSSSRSRHGSKANKKRLKTIDQEEAEHARDDWAVTYKTARPRTRTTTTTSSPRSSFIWEIYHTVPTTTTTTTKRTTTTTKKTTTKPGLSKTIATTQKPNGKSTSVAVHHGKNATALPYKPSSNNTAKAHQMTTKSHKINGTTKPAHKRQPYDIKATTKAKTAPGINGSTKPGHKSGVTSKLIPTTIKGLTTKHSGTTKPSPKGATKVPAGKNTAIETAGVSIMHPVGTTTKRPANILLTTPYTRMAVTLDPAVVRLLQAERDRKVQEELQRYLNQQAKRSQVAGSRSGGSQVRPRKPAPRNGNLPSAGSLGRSGAVPYSASSTPRPRILTPSPNRHPGPKGKPSNMHEMKHTNNERFSRNRGPYGNGPYRPEPVPRRPRYRPNTMDEFAPAPKKKEKWVPGNPYGEEKVEEEEEEGPEEIMPGPAGPYRPPGNTAAPGKPPGRSRPPRPGRPRGPYQGDPRSSSAMRPNRPLRPAIPPESRPNRPLRPPENRPVSPKRPRHPPPPSHIGEPKFAPGSRPDLRESRPRQEPPGLVWKKKPVLPLTLGGETRPRLPPRTPELGPRNQEGAPRQSNSMESQRPNRPPGQQGAMRPGGSRGQEPSTRPRHPEPAGVSPPRPQTSGRGSSGQQQLPKQRHPSEPGSRREPSPLRWVTKRPLPLNLPQHPPGLQPNLLGPQSRLQSEPLRHQTPQHPSGQRPRISFPLNSDAARDQASQHHAGNRVGGLGGSHQPPRRDQPGRHNAPRHPSGTGPNPTGAQLRPRSEPPRNQQQRQGGNAKPQGARVPPAHPPFVSYPGVKQNGRGEQFRQRNQEARPQKHEGSGRNAPREREPQPRPRTDNRHNGQQRQEVQDNNRRGHNQGFGGQRPPPGRDQSRGGFQEGGGGGGPRRHPQEQNRRPNKFNNPGRQRGGGNGWPRWQFALHPRRKKRESSAFETVAQSVEEPCRFEKGDADLIRTIHIDSLTSTEAAILIGQDLLNLWLKSSNNNCA